MLQNMIHAVGPWAPNISIWVTLNPALPWRRAQCTWRLFCMSSSHLGHPMPWRFSVTPLLFCAPKSWINPILHNGSYGCIYWSGMPDWIPTGITGPLWKLQPISLERDSLFKNWRLCIISSFAMRFRSSFSCDFRWAKLQCFVYMKMEDKPPNGNQSRENGDEQMDLGLLKGVP